MSSQCGWKNSWWPSLKISPFAATSKLRWERNWWWHLACFRYAGAHDCGKRVAFCFPIFALWLPFLISLHFYFFSQRTTEAQHLAVNVENIFLHFFWRSRFMEEELHEEWIKLLRYMLEESLKLLSNECNHFKCGKLST